MTQQREDQSEVIALHWSGDLTIRRIAELKVAVQNALAAANHVSIEISTDAECDLTLLQLLCAAHRTASGQEQTLKLCGEFSEQFKMVMNLAGFSRHVGCALDICHSCLWQQIHQHLAGEETHGVAALT